MSKPILFKCDGCGEFVVGQCNNCVAMKYPATFFDTDSNQIREIPTKLLAYIKCKDRIIQRDGLGKYYAGLKKLKEGVNV